MYLKRSQIPDVAVLQAFECAARYGSFTHAARELNLTQSAVSRQIRTLEEQLGVRLFERVRKRVLLSTAGKATYPEVSALLRQLEEVVLQAKSSAQSARTLTIATLPTFGSRWLMRHLSAFLSVHHDVTVNVVSRSEPFDLAAEGIDLAIHYGEANWPHAICTYLRSEEIVPVASQKLLVEWPVHQPSDLLEAPLLHLATRPSLWSEWLQAAGGEDVDAFQGNRFDQFNMIIQATMAGMGFALLPLYMIQDELESGQLAIAINETMQTSKSYYVVLPENKQDNAVSRAFQDWLLAAAQK